jgi:hypothetical protein
MSSIKTIFLLFVSLIQLNSLVDGNASKIEAARVDEPDYFDRVLMDTLSSFKSKLEDNTLTQTDIRLINILCLVISHRHKELSRQRFEEQPVYWYLRKGR